MSKTEKDIRIVDGYFFSGEDDARLAMQEKKKIEYLERHMDYKTPSNVMIVYKRVMDERILKTPIGYEYLRKMQTYLQNSGAFLPEDIPPVKLYVNFEPKLRKTGQRLQGRVQPPPVKEKVKLLPLSIAVNAALILAVIVMFTIAVSSDNPNILNYEKAVTNKYSAWEQELSQREAAVREKEKELKINN